MTLSLWLDRYYTPNGTLGDLKVTRGREEVFSCHTIELPWNGNERGESCIPEGNYLLRKRRSGVVERTSDGEYLEGWEVTGVPGRTYIMIHIANWADELDGCIAVGKYIPPRHMMVNHSTDTFREFMDLLDGEDECRLVITQHITPARA